jgi:hypothetical protein
MAVTIPTVLLVDLVFVAVSFSIARVKKKTQSEEVKEMEPQQPKLNNS